MMNVRNDKLGTFIAAFPGTGKSSLHNKAGFGNNFYPMRPDGTSLIRSPYSNNSIIVYDSDSSTFDKSAFPDNYIDHMKSVIHRHIGYNDFIFLGSTHDDVRDAMKDSSISYVLVYPDRSLKDEYINRYIRRGSPQAFIDMMNDRWDSFIDSCENDSAEKIILTEGQFISDVLTGE